MSLIETGLDVSTGSAQWASTTLLGASVPPQGTTLVYIYVRAPDTGNTAELTFSLDQAGVGPGHGAAGSDEARYELVVRSNNANQPAVVPRAGR